MRLLQHNDKGDIHLTKEYLGDDVPPYAILSHTWGVEEVSFKDLIDTKGEDKFGYDKIRFCGKQALRDGLQYFWVDTCCIDKSSSAELQEAINCMYRWYRDAAKCYVYLADVSKSASDVNYKPSRQQWMPAFRNSRWFTRGWTLQELIAPASVEFFSKEGMKLGTKSSLEETIRETTGIPSDALRGSPLPNFSILQRMSWIERRNTTRAEDKAYSLFGIFDIQMPLLYGEGREKAFKRLQAEIDKVPKSELSVPSTYRPKCFKCQKFGHYANEAANMDITPPRFTATIVAKSDTTPTKFTVMNAVNTDIMPETVHCDNRRSSYRSRQNPNQINDPMASGRKRSWDGGSSGTAVTNSRNHVPT